MKASGITAEFDPLHDGHAYLMEETRRLTGCDALVVAMSGDFVQRGEPAVTDKWARTEAALRTGADLIVEIPTLFCLGNASQYASAAVRILEECGCSVIAFGSESGDIDSIGRAAGYIRENRRAIEEGINALVPEGLSWPAARARVFKELSGCDIPGSSNDILGLEYVLCMEKALPVAVKRTDALSASEIRSILSKNRGRREAALRELEGSMPEASSDALERSALTFPDEWTKVLRYAVMSSDASAIEDCPSGGEGLANLLADTASSEDSFEGIISSVKSRRYTYTRISRLCMQTILGITRSRYPYGSPGYIRVLGFTGKGRKLLAEIKGREGRGLPVITNINKEAGLLDEAAADMLSLDVHAADIYSLMTGRDAAEYSDHVRKPVMI